MLDIDKLIKGICDDFGVPVIPVVTSGDRRFEGYWQWRTGEPKRNRTEWVYVQYVYTRICYNPMYMDTEVKLLCTLLHELSHYLNWLYGGEGHDTTFHEFEAYLLGQHGLRPYKLRRYSRTYYSQVMRVSTGEVFEL